MYTWSRLILLSDLRISGTMTTLLNSKCIVIQDHYQTGRLSERQLRKPSVHSLITRYKKLPWRIKTWKLMNWVKKCKLLALKTIVFNGWLYIRLEDLWKALHFIFNSAQLYQVDAFILLELLSNLWSLWPEFSKAEVTNAIVKCNNSLTLRLDHLL